MLDGKELVQKLGEYGEVSLDVNEKLEVVVSLQAKIDLLGEIKKLADKTATPYDNAAIAWIEKLIKPEAVVAEEKLAEPVVIA